MHTVGIYILPYSYHMPAAPSLLGYPSYKNPPYHHNNGNGFSAGRVKLTRIMMYIQLAGFAFLLFVNFLQCNQLWSAQDEAAVLTELKTLPRYPLKEHSTPRIQIDPVRIANPSSSRSFQEETLALIPIEAYNTCDREISHLSCLRTIIVEDIISSNTNFPAYLARKVQASLHQALCTDYLIAKSKKDDAGYIEEAHVPLCLQHFNTAQVFAIANVDGDNGSTLQRMLLPSEATAFTSAIIPSSSSTVRIVNRQSILMPSMYLPQSPRATHSRYDYSFRENVGNWVWMFGSTRLVNPFTTLFHSNLGLNTPAVSALVLATANALHLDAYNAYREPLIDHQKDIDVGLPTIMLGIGIQKEFKESENIDDLSKTIKLFDFQTKLLQTVAQGQIRPGITVRGELTEAACKNSGIDHCVAMGCPSLTISTNPNLGYVLDKKWKRLVKELSVSSSSPRRKLNIFFAPPAGLTADKIAPSNRRILEIFRDLDHKHNTTVVLQGRKEKEAILLTNEYGLKHTRFNHIEDWREAMSQADLVISARIHGGMIALASETPTIVIPTDYRIWELANIMHLPILALDDLPNETETTVMSVLSKTKFNFDTFEANRRRRLGQYEEILEEVGLEMNPQLATIVHYPEPIRKEST